MGLGAVMMVAGEMLEKRGSNYLNRPSRYVRATNEGHIFLLSLQVPNEWSNKECILYIDYKGYGFEFGNALKYLWRLGVKPSLPFYTPRFIRKFALSQELKKARYYITRAYQNNTINDSKITEENIQQTIELIDVALEKPHLIINSDYSRLDQEANNRLYFKRANTTVNIGVNTPLNKVTR